MNYRSEFAVFAAGQATFGIVETGAAHARKNIVKVALRGSTTSERERVTTNSTLSTVRFAHLKFKRQLLTSLSLIQRRVRIVKNNSTKIDVN